MVARVAALGALALAIVLVVVILFSGGNAYSVHAEFLDAGGLVVGDQVLIGPATVGTITGVGLSANGQADISMSLDSSAAPLPQGTIAHIYQNSLSGIANRYVSLNPGPAGNGTIPDGGVIGADHTYSTVDLDEVLNAFGPVTRAGLRGLIRGEAASIQGRALQANRSLLYLDPALASTSNVTAELTRDAPAFDDLIVQGAQAMAAIASRQQDLTNLIANASTTAAAIGNQRQALQQALIQLPGTLSHGSATFAGLRSTLDALDPLVAASKTATVQLEPFSAALRSLSVAAIPTITELSLLIHNPTGAGDLTSLLLATPALARVGAVAFPRAITEMNRSQAQLDYLREFTPDVAAALTNLGQVGAYYDANGHYVRTQPAFLPFGLNTATNQLFPRPAFARFQGLQTVRSRCPGGAIQPPPDGSAPWAVAGCELTSTPPGP